MVLRDLVRALLRRWYLLLLGLILAVSAMYVTWDRVEQRFTAEGSLLLLPPPSSIERILPNRRDGNPLLYLGDLNQARDVVISLMSSDEVREAFADEFPASTYTVSTDPLSSGPIVVITVDAPEPRTALTAVRQISSEVTTRLRQAQSELSVDKDSQIGVMVLTRPADAEMQNRSQVRATVMVGGAIMVSSVLLVAVIDGLISARRRRLGFDVDGETDDEDADDYRTPSIEGAEQTERPDSPWENSGGRRRTLPEDSGSAYSSVSATASNGTSRELSSSTRRRVGRGRRRANQPRRSKGNWEDPAESGGGWWSESEENLPADASVESRAVPDDQQQDG